MNNQKKSILVLDNDAHVYDQLSSEFEDTLYDVYYLGLVPHLKSISTLLDSHEYAVLLVDEKFDNRVKGPDIVNFVQNTYPDIEVMFLASELSKIKPIDTFRYFKKPIDYRVLAINIQLAARKNYTSKRKKRALQALHDASKHIMMGQSEDEILHLVVDLAGTIMDNSRHPSHFSHLALLQKDESVLIFKEAHHTKEVWGLIEAKLINNQIDLANPKSGKFGIVGRVVKERESQKQGCVHDDEDYIYLHNEVNSQLAVPIKIEEEIYGVINVEHPDKDAFDDNDKYALEALAALIGVAIKKLRPTEKERKQSQALKVLHEMGEKINRGILLDRNQIIKEGVKQAKNLMLNKSDGYLSHFAIKEGRQLVFYEEHNLDKEYQLIKQINGRINLEDPPNGKKGIIGRAVENCETQLVGNVKEDPDYIMFNPHVNSQLAVPIMIDDVVVGAINIEHPDKDAF